MNRTKTILAFAIGTAALSGTVVWQARQSAPEGNREGRSHAATDSLLPLWLKDPQLKGFVLEQVRERVNVLYEPLMSQMALPPQMAQQFVSFLAEAELRYNEQAASMFDGSCTNRSEMMHALAACQNAQEQRAKALLGESCYQQYQAFQETLADRALVTTTCQAAEESNHAPLSQDQAIELLALLREERERVAATTGHEFPRPERELQAILREDPAEVLLQAQVTINQRVCERASSFLHPDQLEVLKKLQAFRLEHLRLRVAMVRDYFRKH